MMEFLFFVSGGFGAISAACYIYKYIKRHDYGYIGMILSRLYLTGVWIYHFFNQQTFSHEDYLFTLGLLMIAEVVNSGIFIISRKYIVKIQENVIKESLIRDYDVHAAQAKVGFFIVSDTGLLKYSNKPLLEILGYEKNEIVDTLILNLVHPDDRKAVQEEIGKKLRGEKDLSIYDFRIIDKQGKVKNVRVISSVITNGHVSIAGSLFLKED